MATNRMLRTLLVLILAFTASPLLAADGPRPGEVKPHDGPAASVFGPILYDPSGNIGAIGNSTGVTNYYVYDSVGRVVEGRAQRNGTLFHQTYTYDPYGNRLTLGGSSGSATYAVDALTNRLLFGAFPFAQYDAAGNVTSWFPPGATGERQFSYDALNMVTEERAPAGENTKFVVHVYTASDERLWSVRALPGAINVGHFTIRDLSGKVLRDVLEDGSGFTVHRDYVYRDGALLAAITPTGAHHYSLDHLGTPRLVTGDSGQKIAEHTYYPFGVEITDTSPTDGPLRFTGHERDADLHGHPPADVDYMHARYYAPNLGRFLSVDPGGFDPSRPQSWNRYTYASNNPINRVDPDGKEDTWAQRAAQKMAAAGQAIKAAGASLNNGGAMGTIADATLGTVGDLVGGSGDMLNVGTATGEAIGSGADAHDMTMAISQDVGRGSALVLTMAAPAASAHRGLTTTQVVHFTDDAGAAAIQSSGHLRTGTYVTKASEVRGMTATQVETRLEIAAGRGQNSFTVRVPNNNLTVPANGTHTSGGAWQRQLNQPCAIPSNCAAAATPK